MAHLSRHHDPNFYNLEEYEIEVEIENDRVEIENDQAEIEDEQEMAAAGGSCPVNECARGFMDKPGYQGTPKHQGDMNHVVNLSYIGSEVAIASPGYYQNIGQLQLEERETLVARVPQQWRGTRPRIRRGLTSWQLGELESIFEETQYPDVITKKDLAKSLFLKESEVQSWFKERRAKERKIQNLQDAPDSTQEIFH